MRPMTFSRPSTVASTAVNHVGAGSAQRRKVSNKRYYNDENVANLLEDSSSEDDYSVNENRHDVTATVDINAPKSATTKGATSTATVRFRSGRNIDDTDDDSRETVIMTERQPQHHDDDDEKESAAAVAGKLIDNDRRRKTATKKKYSLDKEEEEDENENEYENEDKNRRRQQAQRQYDGNNGRREEEMSRKQKKRVIFDDDDSDAADERGSSVGKRAKITTTADRRTVAANRDESEKFERVQSIPLHRGDNGSGKIERQQSLPQLLEGSMQLSTSTQQQASANATMPEEWVKNSWSTLGLNWANRTREIFTQKVNAYQRTRTTAQQQRPIIDDLADDLYTHTCWSMLMNLDADLCVHAFRMKQPRKINSIIMMVDRIRDDIAYLYEFMRGIGIEGKFNLPDDWVSPTLVNSNRTIAATAVVAGETTAPP